MGYGLVPLKKTLKPQNLVGLFYCKAFGRLSNITLETASSNSVFSMLASKRSIAVLIMKVRRDHKRAVKQGKL